MHNKMKELDSKVRKTQRFCRDPPSYISRIGRTKNYHATGQTHLRPKSSGVSKEKGNGAVIKKGKASVGKNRGCVRVKSISYF